MNIYCSVQHLSVHNLCTTNTGSLNHTNFTLNNWSPGCTSAAMLRLSPNNSHITFMFSRSSAHVTDTWAQNIAHTQTHKDAGSYRTFMNEPSDRPAVKDRHTNKTTIKKILLHSKFLKNHHGAPFNSKQVRWCPFKQSGNTTLRESAAQVPLSAKIFRVKQPVLFLTAKHFFTAAAGFFNAERRLWELHRTSSCQGDKAASQGRPG